VARVNTRQYRRPGRLRCGTSRVSRGTAADRLALSNLEFRRSTRVPATACGAWWPLLRAGGTAAFTRSRRSISDGQALASPEGRADHQPDEQENQEADDTQEEQYLRDTGGGGRDAGEAKQCGDQRYDKKEQGKSEHQRLRDTGCIMLKPCRSFNVFPFVKSFILKIVQPR
jgi:hypothetical protein